MKIPRKIVVPQDITQKQVYKLDTIYPKGRYALVAKRNGKLFFSNRFYTIPLTEEEFWNLWDKNLIQRFKMAKIDENINDTKSQQISADSSLGDEGGE